MKAETLEQTQALGWWPSALTVKQKTGWHGAVLLVSLIMEKAKITVLFCNKLEQRGLLVAVITNELLKFLVNV